MASFWQFFNIQIVIFQRVRSPQLAILQGPPNQVIYSCAWINGIGLDNIVCRTLKNDALTHMSFSSIYGYYY